MSERARERAGGGGKRKIASNAMNCSCERKTQKTQPSCVRKSVRVSFSPPVGFLRVVWRRCLQKRCSGRWQQAREQASGFDRAGIGDDCCGFSCFPCTQLPDKKIKTVFAVSFLSPCARKGKWDRALSLLDEMRQAGPRTQPNVRSYTAAIAACGRARKWEEAVALHSKLREEGLTPDQASFNAVIRAAR